MTAVTALPIRIGTNMLSACFVVADAVFVLVADAVIDVIIIVEDFVATGTLVVR